MTQKGLRQVQTRGSSTSSAQGFAIILVLAVLVLLALLSLTYIKLALIDRNIARNYMDHKRAKLIAESGVEYALAKLGDAARKQDFFFDDSWSYKSKTDPSFKINELNINGQSFGISMQTGSSYTANGDVFVLKIEDANSKINVNDGLANKRVKDNTERILNVLGNVLGIPLRGGKQLGERIIGNKRPATGYVNMQQILWALNYIKEDYDKVIDHITLSSWQDENVANPVPLSGNSDILSSYPVKYNTDLTTAGLDVYRYGRGKAADGHVIGTAVGEEAYAQLKFAPAPGWAGGTDCGVYGLDELNPQWIEIVSRSPVNVNLSRRETLIALIQGLSGFFISERRRNVPFSDSPYSLLDSTDLEAIYWLEPFDYSPAYVMGSRHGDELGILYDTPSIDSFGLYGPTAQQIVDEIQNCIKRSGTYSTKWFGGPFKTWRQFHAFCDYLVDQNIIKDKRAGTFAEYDLTQPQAYSLNFPSDSIAQRIASQAIADVLKANFNPNLHLNELNPDANLQLLVDKTDLIVNSTEFCFTPVGYFEIESRGLVLKDDSSGYRIIAEKTIGCTAQAFNVYRETSQAHFLRGNISGDPSIKTINNKALEVGPEPSHVDVNLARQNEWGGYISFATIQNPSVADTRMRACFINGFSLDARYSDDKSSLCIKTRNLADRTEGITNGPYEYGSNNRLCRGFRKPSDITIFRAPSDQRIDGAYVERHAGLFYEISSSILNPSGIFSYWVKPSFHPESTGKPRVYLSLSKTIYYKVGKNLVHHGEDTIFFSNYFCPTHWPDSYTPTKETQTPSYDLISSDPLVFATYFKTLSMLFAMSAFNSTNYNNTTPNPLGGHGHITPALNHLGHFNASCYTKTNYFKNGQWAHIMCRWNSADTQPVKILINGQIIANTSIMQNHPGTIVFDNFYKQVTHVRIGGPTKAENPEEDNNRNWTSDSTIDEFFIFNGDDTAVGPISIWQNGRYYKEADGMEFTSGEIDLWQQRQKNLARRSNVSIAPDGASSEIPATPDKIEIIGLAWTLYDEYTSDPEYENVSATARLRDYKDSASSTPAFYNIDLSSGVSLFTSDSDPDINKFYSDSGFSNTNKTLGSVDKFKYKVKFSLAHENGDLLNAVLLYSPVFDDITIYYSDGVKILNYSFVD